MAQVAINAQGPDFTLTGQTGEQVSLSDFRGRQHVVLVFNRGFS